MNGYQKLLAWQWAHNSIAMDLIRAFMGVALTVRGLLFALNPDTLVELDPNRQGDWLTTYVMLAHVIGGPFLLAGMFTRIAALAQLPIIVGAVMVVHVREGLASPTQSLELAVLVLVILAVIFVFGPGRYSLDYYFFGRDKAFGTDEEQPA